MSESKKQDSYSYRASRNTLTRMTAIRLGPEQIELAVQVWDLCRKEGAVFVEKFKQALEDAPRTLVIYLSSGPELSAPGLHLLAWAQNTCEQQGITFTLRPSSAQYIHQLRSVGLSDNLEYSAA